jgi:hypothetical protein
MRIFGDCEGGDGLWAFCNCIRDEMMIGSCLLGRFNMNRVSSS